MTDASRGIDHVVVAVHDLDVAAAFYRTLGFQVGARNRHPWGTENRLIQFQGSFIELITVGGDGSSIPDHEPGRFSFGAFVRDYLRRREGGAMLALDSNDAKADAALFAREGIGAFEPFFFERQGRRPDGSETHVAFTLAFARDAAAPDCGFFVCQQHFPKNFWNPAFQHHENEAQAITAVGMVALNPGTCESFLTAFSGSKANQDVSGGLSINLRGSRLTVTSDPWQRALQLNSITIGVRGLAAQAERLWNAGVGFRETSGTLCIPADSAFGLDIWFEEC